MTSQLTKLISVAGAATQGEWIEDACCVIVRCDASDPDARGMVGGGHYKIVAESGTDATHIALHSPTNMLKLYRAIEERDKEVDKAVELITTACSKKCRCTERVSPCPHCDSIMEGELLYSHALQNFNQALKELTK